MRDLIVELKHLRLHGMAAGWAEMLEQGNVEVASSQWLLERLLQAESADRAVRLVSHQMNAAKFPVHRDLAGFDFDGSPVGRQLVMRLAGMTFTKGAHDLVLVGGPGSGKTHLATAIGVAGIMHHGRFCRNTALL
jgi:DNA replication protein DnaC